MNIRAKFALNTAILTGLLALPIVFVQPAGARAAGSSKVESLPLCGKCPSPIVFEKSGIGSAHAVAKARITYASAKENCENYAMEPNSDCDQQAKEMVKSENGKIYTASADCVHGKLTDANGENFVYAGIWSKRDDKYLAGKTRWRWGPGSKEDTGKIVGEDGPTNGFGVASTAALLCPNGIGATSRHRRR